jgi:hypothetical protein
LDEGGPVFWHIKHDRPGKDSWPVFILHLKQLYLANLPLVLTLFEDI